MTGKWWVSILRYVLYTLHTVRDSDREPLLTPATKLGQGNIFSNMCQEFCSQWEYLGRYPRPPPPPHRQVHPRQVHPAREQRMLGDTGNKRAVRVLLECILVFYCAHPGPCPGPIPVQSQWAIICMCFSMLTNSIGDCSRNGPLLYNFTNFWSQSRAIWES